MSMKEVNRQTVSTPFGKCGSTMILLSTWPWYKKCAKSVYDCVVYGVIYMLKFGLLIIFLTKYIEITNYENFMKY